MVLYAAHDPILSSDGEATLGREAWLLVLHVRLHKRLQLLSPGFKLREMPFSAAKAKAMALPVVAKTGHQMQYGIMAKASSSSSCRFKRQKWRFCGSR